MKKIFLKLTAPPSFIEPINPFALTGSKIGGSTYQVPLEVNSDRGTSLALRWLIKSARSRSGRTMVSKLSNEILDAYNNTGAAVRKKEETHKMAEANKAFAQFRF